MRVKLKVVFAVEVIGIIYKIETAILKGLSRGLVIQAPFGPAAHRPPTAGPP